MIYDTSITESAEGFYVNVRAGGSTQLLGPYDTLVSAQAVAAEYPDQFDADTLDYCVVQDYSEPASSGKIRVERVSGRLKRMRTPLPFRDAGGRGGGGLAAYLEEVECAKRRVAGMFENLVDAAQRSECW